MTGSTHLNECVHQWAVDKLSNQIKPSDWPNKTEKFKLWTEAEKTKLNEAASRLPQTLLDAFKGKVFRASESKYKNNPASQIGTDLTFYDSAFSSTDKLSRVLAHELAHVIYENFNDSQKNDYDSAMGWMVERTKKSNNIILQRKDGFVQPDGEISPTEDFANNTEYYLFDTKHLLTVYPPAINWIKYRFGPEFKLQK